jgi:hypothetical protein
MAYKVVCIRLTDWQLEQIEAVVMSGHDYALLAEPIINEGVLKVRICTNEQYEVLRPAILKAHKLPQWRKKQ